MHPEQAIAALRFDPLIPLWAIVLLGGVAAIIVGMAAFRRARGTVLRLAAFAVLLLWLAGPRLVQETRETLPDIGLLVVDNSASMQVGDRAALAEKARADITAQAATFPDLELRTVNVPEQGDSGTRLFSAINQALADVPRSRLAGTITITDGEIHDVPKTPPGGEPLNVLIPAKGEETDRSLRVIEAPTYGVVGKSVTLRVAVEDYGVAHPGTANLTIRRDGDPPRVENVPVGVPQSIEVPITRAGPTVMEFSADKLPGEASTLNNRAVVEINGVRDRLRVLLISGEPNPGERAWRRLLKSDPSVDLVHFTILRPPEKDDLTPLNELSLIAFPVRELFLDKINEFDLIIFDRFQNRGLLPLPYLANIADRVRDGGALLMSVGPEFSGPASLAATPLGSVLPAAPAPFDAVVDGRFRPRVTALGERHPVTEGLAGGNPPGNPSASPTWGPWYRHVNPTDVNGEVLMRTPDGAPLLILNRVGKGRTAMLLSDQIWLWSRGHDGGGPQAELLRRVAHWLMKEPALDGNALTAQVANGRLTIEQRSTAPTPPTEVTVTDPDGKTQTLHLTPTNPGRATVTVAAGTPGVWQATDGEHTAYAAAGAANPLEIADLRATASLVGPLARKSGGGVHWLGTAAHPDVPDLRRTEPDRDASGSSWIGLERRHDHLVTGIAALALLPSWIALPLMLGFMVGAWRQEGT
ncbi:MAG TPA: hypothetical protein VMU81_24475 [Acetobacteraceae bacterium]|nr:hypothetical protein [Acetobacteraceae bacterium]